MKSLLLIMTLAATVMASAEPAKKPDDAHKADPARAPDALKDAPIKMEAFVISEDTTMSFGFGVKILKSGLTGKVMTMFVEGVDKTSDAELKGLKSGAEITAIEGKSVSDFDATFKSGSELRRLFIGRAKGDKVQLVISNPGEHKPKPVTVFNRPGGFKFIWTGSDPTVKDRDGDLWQTGVYERSDKH